MNEIIKKEIELLKDNPGCYLMYNDKNEIIYIGKAKNLKKRVSQYFLRVQNGKTAAMVSHVDHFETIITSSEKEALILEMNLIQKHHPRYNILLMDDKHYPYIELHSSIKDPYISIARNLKNKKSQYFGPYPSSNSAYEVINIINSIYPLRKCKNVPKSPCLYYHMHNCLGPCINKIDDSEYQKIIDNIVSFLKGNNEEVIKELKNKINECSLNLDYENALEYKKKLDSILYINEKQTVEFLDKIDRDFIGFYNNENYTSITILIYRKGLLIGRKNFFFEIVGDLSEFISSILFQYYQSNMVPKEIYVANNEVKQVLENYWKTTIKLPKQGKMLNIVATAIENAKESFSTNLQLSTLKKSNLELLEKLGKLLNIDTPLYIELFDNSHLQGTNAIGAMVAFINGEEVKKMNRKFNIESYNKKDDLSSMKEVIYRRYSRVKKENQRLPDLIIVDGGINQIKVTKEIIKVLELDINIVGLIKNDKHQTRGLMDQNYNEININDNELFIFLSKMQDVVHRYAISTHIRKRNKSMFNSIFDDIEGIGIKRKEMLIKKYPTLLDLKKVELEELKQYLPSKVANNLYNKLKEL